MPRVIHPAALRAIREAVGLSQVDLGLRSGLNRSSVSNIEAGKHAVTPATQRALADTLGVPLDAITIAIPEPEPVPEAAAS